MYVRKRVRSFWVVQSTDPSAPCAEARSIGMTSECVYFFKPSCYVRVVSATPPKLVIPRNEGSVDCTTKLFAGFRTAVPTSATRSFPSCRQINNTVSPSPIIDRNPHRRSWNISPNAKVFTANSNFKQSHPRKKFQANF